MALTDRGITPSGIAVVRVPMKCGSVSASCPMASTISTPGSLRLYEREGLLKPSRTEGNTRLYSEDDLEQLETILALTRDLGVNLAGVEIILNMRRKMEQMQGEVNEFMEYVKRELARGIDDWEQRLGTALVKASPTDLVRAARPDATVARTETTKKSRGA